METLCLGSTNYSAGDLGEKSDTTAQFCDVFVTVST